MDDLAYITGLMAQNTDEPGFIPAPTIENRYITKGRYAIQADLRGRKVGYILHGAPTAYGVLTIAQACIAMDKRNRGFGQEAVAVVIERAIQAGAKSIKLRCADDLESNLFWQALGFEATRQDMGGERRGRLINTYVLDLWQRLF